ncbi:hypothetical protein [Streptomyces sp. CA-106110]|uniref:hypothetical protein n=1 Tax=Streptomyces sp. CA-106110 TaxID=3240044 RepID=UPI003D93391E
MTEERRECRCGCHRHEHHRCDCACHHGDREHCHDHDHDHGKGDGGGGHKPPDGTTIGWKNPNRPGRHCGTSTGQVPGGRLTPGDFKPQPGNQWPGQRGDLYLPFLFLRANAGDLGARPVVGPFWESPDILLLAGVEPSTAPPVPPELGQTALAGKPNTVYAHVWNFGLAAAPNVVVEFYWCDPSLGIGPLGAHLIGYASVALGARGSARAHAVVKCPTAWVPTFVNGGHECLLVRVWEETSDGLGTPAWDAALNRHIGQRNIHVAAGAGLHATARLTGEPLLLPTPMAPLTLKVGPLYGEPAQVQVARAAPHEMPWLQLRTGTRGQFPAQAAPTGTALLSPPTTIGGGTSNGGAAEHQVTGDDQQIAFTTSDKAPGPGEAHVYRVTASQQGQVFGGYTVVLLG